MATLLFVAFGFVVAFVVVPWLVLPNPRSARNQLDRIVINFLRWTAIVMVGTEVLAAVHLYETTTLILLCLIAGWYFNLRPRGWSFSRSVEGIHHTIFRTIDRLDRRERRSWVPWNDALPAAAVAVGANRQGTGEAMAFSGVGASYGGGTTTLDWNDARVVVPFRRHRTWGWAAMRRHGVRTFLMRPGILVKLLLAAPILVVLGEAAYIHFQLPIQHSALTPGDDYVHMDWAAEFGKNKVFPNGIYPMGMASVLALVAKAAPGVNIADVTRYSGPIVGTLIVFGVFYTALRLSRSPGGALLAAGAFGLYGSRADWREPWARQVGALPQELCVGLALLSLGVLALAVVSKEKDHRWTLLGAGIAMGMTHPLPVAFYVLLAPGLAIIVGIASGRIGRALWVTGYAVLGVLLGFLYIPIAYAVGVPFYAGIGAINPFAGASTPGATTVGSSDVTAVGYTPLSHWEMAFLAVGTIGGILLTARRQTRIRGALLLGLCAVGAALLVAYNPTWIGLPAFYAGRTANIAGPMSALCFATGVGALAVVMRKVNLRHAAASLGLGVALLFAFGHYFPNVPRPVEPIEYDSEANVAQKIVASNVNLTYTMVGMPEQRQRSIGQSFFVEMWVFARDVNVNQAQDPSYELPIPTQSVYIFVEKKPFPTPKLAPLGATEEYYRDPAKRARIETIAYQFCQTYMKYHTDMSVYYDDSALRVYKINQVPDAETALYSKQFKDYTWHPGALFNSGPTNPLAAPTG